MKLTKAAFAVAAIVGSVAASAQTANVTLYGYINTSIESNRGSTRTTSAAVTRMTANSSQFGFRGSEDLGGGLSAVFNLQSGFGSDDGTLNGGALFNREAWVGLQGGFGQLRVGYGLTAYDDVLGLSHQNIGSTGLQNRNAGLSSGPGFAGNQLFTNYGRGGTAGCATDSNFDARAANSLSYQTPDFAGFRVRTTYALIDEVPNGCRLWDTGAVYSNGPITAGLAYSMHSKFRGLGGATVGAGTVGNTTGSHDQNTIRAYARYNFGVARIDGAYEVMSFKVASGTLKAKYFEAHHFVCAINTSYAEVVSSVGANCVLVMRTRGVTHRTRTNGCTAQAAKLRVHRICQTCRNRAVRVNRTGIPESTAVWNFVNQRVSGANAETSKVRSLIAKRVCRTSVKVAVRCATRCAATTVVGKQLVTSKSGATGQASVTVLQTR